MTKTLTEQWRDGELPTGDYYIKLDDGSFTTDRYYGKCFGFSEEIPDEVLAPVPSYDEYQDIIQQNVNQESAIETYIEDIKRLQEQKQKVIALIKDGRFVEALQELEND